MGSGDQIQGLLFIQQNDCLNDYNEHLSRPRHGSKGVKISRKDWCQTSLQNNYDVSMLHLKKTLIMGTNVRHMVSVYTCGCL